MDTVHVLKSPMTPSNHFLFKLPMDFNPKCGFMVMKNYKMFVLCFKVSFILILCMCLHMLVCTSDSRCLRRPKEELDPLLTELTGYFEPPSMGTRNQTQILCKCNEFSR